MWLKVMKVHVMVIYNCQITGWRWKIRHLKLIFKFFSNTPPPFFRCFQILSLNTDINWLMILISLNKETQPDNFYRKHAQVISITSLYILCYQFYATNIYSYYDITLYLKYLYSDINALILFADVHGYRRCIQNRQNLNTDW